MDLRKPRSEDRGAIHQFVGISAIGLILNNIIIYLLNDKCRLNFYLSKLVAIGGVTLWNFFMNYFFTFNA